MKHLVTSHERDHVVISLFAIFRAFTLSCMSCCVMCSQRRRAGVEGLIEIENPNRVAQKTKKVTQIELDEPKQLSRRERCVFGVACRDIWSRMEQYKALTPSSTVLCIMC